MVSSNIKDEARRMIEQVPDDATWDDLLYEIYVRQSVEAGLDDCRQGRVVALEEVRRRMS